MMKRVIGLFSSILVVVLLAACSSDEASTDGGLNVHDYGEVTEVVHPEFGYSIQVLNDYEISMAGYDHTDIFGEEDLMYISDMYEDVEANFEHLELTSDDDVEGTEYDLISDNELKDDFIYYKRAETSDSANYYIGLEREHGVERSVER